MVGVVFGVVVGVDCRCDLRRLDLCKCRRFVGKAKEPNIRLTSRCDLRSSVSACDWVAGVILVVGLICARRRWLFLMGLGLIYNGSILRTA